MALPVKPDSTQEGCHPISSNCVIWQGPDIPCINLCHGDAVSDVVAKLAEELCTVLGYVDLSNYDLSCFNPVCPTLDNFQDLIQFIINKLCELQGDINNGGSVTPSAGCPDCLVAIAPCFYTTDSLGNTVTALQLKDYAIAIGNKVCNLITQITGLSSSISSLETRVTNIENNCCGTPPEPTSTQSCLRSLPPGGLPVTQQLYFVEQAFCALQNATGTPVELTSAISYQCPSLDSTPQLSNPLSNMSALSGWVTVGNYNTVADAITNMWLTICDMRTAVATLQTDLTACCTDTCADIAWDFTATFLAPKDIVLAISGSVPVSFSYCNPSDATITIYDAYGNSYTVTGQDIVGNIGGSITVDISGAPTLVPSVYYNVMVNMCLTNGTYICSSNDSYAFNNNSFCPTLNLTNPAPGDLNVQFLNPVTANAISYTVNVFDATTNAFVGSAFYTGSTLAASLNNTFTTGAGTYYAQLTITQNGHTITCGPSTNQVVV